MRSGLNGGDSGFKGGTSGFIGGQIVITDVAGSVAAPELPLDVMVWGTAMARSDTADCPQRVQLAEHRTVFGLDLRIADQRHSCLENSGGDPQLYSSKGRRKWSSGHLNSPSEQRHAPPLAHRDKTGPEAGDRIRIRAGK